MRHTMNYTNDINKSRIARKELEQMLFLEIKNNLFLLRKQTFLNPTASNIANLHNYIRMLKEELDL